MKILSLRLKNLNSLKGEWKVDFTAEPFASNGCSPSPVQPVPGRPPCWTPFASRCTTKHHDSIPYRSRKTT